MTGPVPTDSERTHITVPVQETEDLEELVGFYYDSPDRPELLVCTGTEPWVTFFEVVFRDSDWQRRNETGVPITARRREWEFTDVTWPSGQCKRVGTEVVTILGTGEVGTGGIRRAANDLFGAVIVPELDGQWERFDQLRAGDLIIGWSYPTRRWPSPRWSNVMDVAGIEPAENGMVTLRSEQWRKVWGSDPSLRQANEWVRIKPREDQ